MITNYMKLERKQNTKTSFILIAAKEIDNRIIPINTKGERVLNLLDVFPPERAIKMNAQTYLKNYNSHLSKLEYFDIEYPTYSFGDIQGTNDLLIFNLDNDVLEVFVLKNKKPFISEVKGLFENESIFDIINEVKSEKPNININKSVFPILENTSND